ncbi:hypothetical protein SDC9_183993 [bioreactor metagenome]|uniref:Uncharacterized protein n=1 Tax=bioreactor metagenome TaxID=1076179 RepID=A0A645HK19_9ZZZZ
MRVDNPQHTFIFTTNTGDIQTVVLLVEHHFTNVGFIFFVCKLKHFHFFMGAGIQQGQ